MSSDKTTRAKRRNLVAKHSHKFNAGYPHKPVTAYKRKSKGLQREIESSLADTLLDKWNPVAGFTERVTGKIKKGGEKPRSE